MRDLLPYPVRRVAQLGSRSYGLLTSAARVLPSFLICGGQRCGVTSLHRALAAHPAVVKATLHTANCFDAAYHRGIGWYHRHFPLQNAARRVEARLGVPAQAFESSPYYMYHPYAIARIAHDLPQIRIIVLVRDPVERAYSHYAHEVARGNEPQRSFARALALEPVRLRGQHERLTGDQLAYSFAQEHHVYRARGEYARYLELMASYVDRKRILVVDSGRFFTGPDPVYDLILDFLGLPQTDYPAFEQGYPRPGSAPIEEWLRHKLTAHYAPWDERLADWLGDTPSWKKES